MNFQAFTSGIFVIVAISSARAQAPGQRPYEMVWAGREADTRQPLCGFEDLDRWTVECEDALASFERTTEQQIWGRYVGKLTYRGAGNQPVVAIRPPDPIQIAERFDCVNLWIHGNNWAWAPDPSTPQVEIRVLLQSADGRSVPVVMGRVRWKEWWLMHRRLTGSQLADLGDKPVCVGIEVVNGRNESDRTLYFDNLAIYQERMPPLTFAPRPKRPITLPPGQSVGNNIGAGTLPFPTREETILPDNLDDRFQVSLESSDGAYRFRYDGEDGQLVYRYKPATGTLSDLSAQWMGRGKSFRPMAGGGIIFAIGDEATPIQPETAVLLHCRREGDAVVSTWRCTFGNRTADVTYTFRLWQKSLVLDVKCEGGHVGEFRIGKVIGLENPRLVTLPYLTGAEQRPAVLVAGPVEKPLFVFTLMDHYRTNGSLFWFANGVADDGVTQNGGSRYLPKTNGARNSCFERLFLTVTPRFEETLPNIPNPKSPWMHVTGERLWRAHGASDRQRDYRYWKKVARYGMTKVVITDHETGWRDGGESFTMRTRAAPGKGGDEGQADYARKIQSLGFRYGIYNNYTDFAPVNEHWDEDYVTRTSDNEWRTAWARCYNPKPARAVELEARLAPIIQEKFALDTAYCDVHTAVRPWSYCDFDARVPGAGAFAATFYAYGEIMVHQKRTWNGPVYSEGNNHWYYCGLTDGNYGQDQVGRLAVNPWLVDFDLRKLHPMCCNFGMGNPGMFYGRASRLGKTAHDRRARLDRFLAATLAFGHTGFLVFEGGFENAIQSYYCLQQVHAHYARQSVERIRYADGEGNLLDTSVAVASGVFRRSQIATRYSNGLEVLVNGHPDETWRIAEFELPPNGWLVRDTTSGKLTAFSAVVDGHRVDYVDSPEYLYADGRGQITRFAKVTCDGKVIVRVQEGPQVEVIPVGACSVFGVSLDGAGATALALDDEGNSIGNAKTRLSRGLVYVTPIPNAVSYQLTPAKAPTSALCCERVSVVPGELVHLDGAKPRAFRVPRDAAVGEQIWQQVDGAWIDFTVEPMATPSLHVDDESLFLDLVPHLPHAMEATVQMGNATRQTTLHPEKTVHLKFPRPTAEGEHVWEIPLHIVAGDLAFKKTWWIKAEDAIVPIHSLSKRFETGQLLRGESEKPLDDVSRAHAHWAERACANDSRMCLFMHPPYVSGVGYTFALFDLLSLPDSPRAALRCDVGKADGSDPGDGILFRVAVVDHDGAEYVAAEKQWIKHAWTPIVADLSRWRGQRVRIKLITDVGPGNNSSGDWGCWANLRIEGIQPTLVSTVHDQSVNLARHPGPTPVGELTRADLQKATRGVLHFRGIGLQCGGQYVSYAKLNGISLGRLPAAGGREGEDEWSDAAIVLPAETVKGLCEWNTLELENPGHDSFKIGRFWIELLWKDGRNASSQITATVYTQPPDWRHAQGTGVPFDKNIETVIRIRLKEELK